MLDLTLQRILTHLAMLPVLAVAISVAVAAAARLLGERGPQWDGRMSPDPSAHLAPLGSVLILLFGLGWARPVAVDGGRLRGGRAGLVLCALAGTLAPLLLGLLGGWLRQPALALLGSSSGLAAVGFLEIARQLCLWVAVFNLLPLPPLTGGLLLQAVLPGPAAWLSRHALAPGLLLAAFIAVGEPRQVLAPLYIAVLALLSF